MVVLTRRRDLYRHLMHPERQTSEYSQNMSVQDAFVGLNMGALDKS